MARLFRLWEKKRGERRTGSRLMGGVGEALFSGAMFVLGIAALTSVVAGRVWGSEEQEALTPGFGFWVVVLVSTSLILIGGIGWVYTVLQVGTSRERRAAIARQAQQMDILHEAPAQRDKYPSVPHDANLTNSPGTMLAFRLPTTHNSAWKLAASTLFGLLWNGLAAVLVALALNRHLVGRPDWLLSVSALVFVAVGAWAVNYFVKLMLLHTGIGPTHVEISGHPLYPGGVYQVFLSQTGRLAITRLTVSIVCEEEATYHQGTDVRTERQAICEHPVFVKEAFRIEPGAVFEHQCELRIPESAMHSFQSTHNAVSWKLVVRLEAVSWPPCERSFPVVVHPLANAASHA
ncbi:MAG TPA: hypothetical protein VL096_13915 [Pirellulaceae bacterium]|nr:hypothetical protein [Pirellulaceae bacterium]